MRRQIFVAMSLSVLIGSIAEAQSTLRVMHDQDVVVIMKYCPRNEFPRMRKKRIPPGQTVPVPLTGEDPFIVHCVIPDESGRQVQVSRSLVSLKRDFAGENVYPLNLTFVKDRGRKIQVMSAKLKDPRSGNVTDLSVAPDSDDVSDFIRM